MIACSEVRSLYLAAKNKIELALMTCRSSMFTFHFRMSSQTGRSRRSTAWKRDLLQFPNSAHASFPVQSYSSERFSVPVWVLRHGNNLSTSSIVTCYLYGNGLAMANSYSHEMRRQRVRRNIRNVFLAKVRTGRRQATVRPSDGGSLQKSFHHKL